MELKKMRWGDISTAMKKLYASLLLLIASLCLFASKGRAEEVGQDPQEVTLDSEVSFLHPYATECCDPLAVPPSLPPWQLVETDCLSMCEPLPRGGHINGVWFPQKTLLFQPLIADPRQVMNAASLRFNDTVIGKHVGAVSFGDDFIILRLQDLLWWHGDMDLGVQAGVFTVFDLDHPEACLVNTDFFVAALVTYAVNNWSFRLRLWHLSSHLGDEFLLSNPGFDRCNLSDEGADLFISYQMGKAVRLYGGIGDIVARDKEFPEQPFYIEGGTEIRVLGGPNCFNRIYIQPFLAIHLRAWEEHQFDIDQTYALGVEWSKIDRIGRKFRIFLEYHNGFSKEGQFVKERSDYVAIKINYGF